MNAIALPRPIVAFRRTRFYFRWTNRLQRWGRAWRYATGTWSRDDAGWIILDAQPVAGYTILETLDTDSVIEWAEELFGSHPRMAEWAASAVARVGYKWSGTGDIQSAASDWAIDLIRQYAADDGVTLAEPADDDPIHKEL